MVVNEVLRGFWGVALGAILLVVGFGVEAVIRKEQPRPGLSGLVGIYGLACCLVGILTAYWLS